MPNIRIPLTKAPQKFRIFVAIGAVIIIILLLAVMAVVLIQRSAEVTGLRQFVPTECIDRDEGKIVTEFGTCIDGGRQTYSDSCVLTGVREELKVQEWFCQNNRCMSEIINCAPGFLCNNGACVKV